MTRGPVIKYDKERVSFNLAKVKKNGFNFEIVINPDEAMGFRAGKRADVRDAIRSEHIFKDASRGELANEHELEQAFGSRDALVVAAFLIKNGIIQLTDEHRSMLREEKRKKILSIIHTNAIDPKTKLPHPIARLENAFEEAKVRIDEHKSAEDQVQDIVRAIQIILPIKFAIAELQIHLSANVASKQHNVIKKYGTIVSESWLKDGSWLGKVELPAGLKLDLIDYLNGATHGGADIKVLKE
ncbi:MAG: ribosome assembly factor SBDS [archaeon]